MSDRSATVEALTRRVEQLAAGDPDSTRLVYAMVIALLVVGLLLVLLAVWMIRRTRTDLALLAPLERMSDAKWRKSDPDGRRALLDEVRPPGAAVPAWPRPQDDAAATVLPPPDAESVAETLGEPVGEPVLAPPTPSVPDPSSELDPLAETAPEPSVESAPEPPVESAPETEPEPSVETAPETDPVPPAEPITPVPPALVVDALVIPAGKPAADGETPDAAPDDASVER